MLAEKKKHFVLGTENTNSMQCKIMTLTNVNLNKTTQIIQEAMLNCTNIVRLNTSSSKLQNLKETKILVINNIIRSSQGRKYRNVS